MATIYEVVESGYQIRFYFYPTKKAAVKHLREFEPEFDGAICEIRSMDVVLTRAGLVAELNHLISKTCFNE